MASDDEQYEVGQVVDGRRWTGEEWEPVSEDEPAESSTAEIAASPTTTYEVGQVVNGHRWTGEQWEPVAPAGAAPIPGSQASKQAPDNPVGGRWWAWVAAAAALIIAVSLAGAAASNGDGAAARSSASPERSIDVPTASNAPAPSLSPAPSLTPDASDPATPGGAVSVDEAREQFRDAFGTFEPLSMSGSGDLVVPLPPGSKTGIVTITYPGYGKLAVVALGPDDQAAADIIRLTTGPFKGSSLYGASAFSTEVAKLRVDADGPWTLKVEPVWMAQQISFPAKESGAGVFLYVGGASEWTLSHQGSDNFVVTERGATGLTNLLVNEIGTYNGTVRASGAPAVISVAADGRWTIDGS